MAFFSVTKFIWGVSAALFAPFLMVLGFMIWDDNWTKKNGSAFSLNMFKCNVTATWFLVVIIVTIFTDEAEQSPLSTTTVSSVWSESLIARIMVIRTKLSPFQNADVKFLMASSTVGILIGDWTWIEGLKHLGARKVIVMDSLKPFLAAMAGWAFFDEKFNSPVKASIGLVLTVMGVALVGFEVEGKTDADDGGGEYDSILEVDDRSNNLVNSLKSTPNNQHQKMNESSQYGLFMAVSNVVLHTLGATLTKKFGAEMTTWEINFVRFGFSGLCMLLLTCLLLLRDRISRFHLGESQVHCPDLSASKTQCYGSVPITSTLPSTSPSHQHNTYNQENPWYTLPKLSRASWVRVTLGVAFVSFMSP